MYVRQLEYSPKTKGAEAKLKPVWHIAREKDVFPFTKKVSSNCGLDYELNTGKNEVAKKIRETVICRQCQIVVKNKEINTRKLAGRC